MSSEYYSLEKAAEVLGLPTAEINRLREKSVLRAFRDGSSWKFRKVDVDNYLAETIKKRSKKNEAKVGTDSDFDLLSMDDDAEEIPTLLADSASFDSLMEDGLALDDEMIDAPVSLDKTDKAEEAAPEGEVVFADDDLVLDDDDGLSLTEGQLPKDDLSLADLGLAAGPAASDIDLAVGGDDLVLDGGSSGHLDLAGDSGLSLLDVADDVDLQPVAHGGSDVVLELADDDDILSLVDEDLATENTSTIAIPVEDDFQLTPDMGQALSDDSESASQVIALEEDNMFGPPPDTEVAGPGMEASPFGGGMPDMDQSAATMDGGFGAPGAFTAPTAGEFVAASPTYAPAPASTEANYSPILVTFLAFCAALLAVPGVMLLDLIIHIWSWNEPFVINSTIMDLFAGIAGLK